jgi:uncharacterized protein involved in exopolysaccharide biosynthesis
MEEEIKLLVECYYVIKKRLAFIFLAVFISLAGAYLYVKSSPKIYQATATLWPLGGNGSVNPMLAQLASLSGNNFGTQGHSVEISVLLKSRSLAEIVAAKLDLKRHYFRKNWDGRSNQWNEDLKEIPIDRDAALILLDKMMVIKDVKNGSSIILNVEDEDPLLAVKINDTYLAELQNYLNENTFTEAKRQRKFTGMQLINNNKELLKVGKELNEFYKHNIAVAVVDVDLRLPDPIADYDMAVSGLILDEKVNELQKQKEELDEKRKTLLVENVPRQLYLEYMLQKKQVLEALNGILYQQYETAKIQAAKEDISFSIIDEAIVPKIPIKPKMLSTLAMAFLSSTFLSLLAVFSIEYVQKLKGKNLASLQNEPFDQVSAVMTTTPSLSSK